MKLYKGSVYPITVVYAPCYCQDASLVEDLSLTFFTTPGSGFTFSGDSITISGMTATVVLQPGHTEALDDGVLRFVSEFTYSGNPETWACATDKYILTPPHYEPIDFVTTDTVDEVVEGKMADYYTSAQTENLISSALTEYATSAETSEAISAATQNMVTSTHIGIIWVGTSEQYAEITTKDPNTLYFINDN